MDTKIKRNLYRIIHQLPSCMVVILLFFLLFFGMCIHDEFQSINSQPAFIQPEWTRLCQDQTTFVFQWEAVHGAEVYDIIINDQILEQIPALPDTQSYEKEISLPELSHYTVYFCQLKARNDFQQNLGEEIVIYPPPKITDLTYSNCCSYGFTLSWAEIPDIQGYQILLDTQNPPIDVLTVTESAYFESNLQNYTGYFLQVVPILREHCLGEPSEIIEIKKQAIEIEGYELVKTITTPENSVHTDGIPFLLPLGMAYTEDRLYIVDVAMNNLQSLSFDHKVLSRWESISSYSEGSVNIPLEAMIGPFDVALDADGMLYITDVGDRIIRKWDQAGYERMRFGEPGDEPGQFSFPTAIAYHADLGTLFIADQDKHEIQQFTPQGEFVGRWDSHDAENQPYTIGDIIIAPETGDVFCTDILNGKVHRHEAGGAYIYGFGSFGFSNDQFAHPDSIAMDPCERFVLIGDAMNDAISAFTLKGEFLFSYAIDKTGADDVSIFFGKELELDRHLCVYQADVHTMNVKYFCPILSD